MVTKNNKIFMAILVASLGYFVDIYDLILFSVVRVPSLQDLGFDSSAITSKGLLLLNLQMFGMLVGGIFFGVLGDRRGRLSVLFGSILLYSFANLFNAYVQDIYFYYILRFVAGFGLAGELGAGVTLVSELLPKEKRGYGTTIIATVGVSGALLAWTVTKYCNWRTAYLIGGCMGISLLFFRVGVLESVLFSKVKDDGVSRGNFFSLFKNKQKFLKYLACICIGMQLWYVVGILITLSPEFSTALKSTTPIIAGESVFYCYFGLIFGDLFSGLISQRLQSRKKAMFLFLSSSGLCIFGYFFFRGLTPKQFYTLCFVMGLTSGYWAMFVQIAAEQFGTNLRATVTTTVPNFVRGSLVPLSLLFSYLKGGLGILSSGLIVGIVCISISFWGFYYLKECFHTDLDFLDS